MTCPTFNRVVSAVRKSYTYDFSRDTAGPQAQEKQADAVVLGLGSDRAKPGAGSFAAEKPNFVNVAVSRAERRP